MSTFDEVWELIKIYQNENFRTKRGKVFKYHFNPPEGQTIIITTLALTHVSKGSFRRAFNLGKCDGPGAYRGTEIGGSSYVWAILHDRRVNCFDL